MQWKQVMMPDCVHRDITEIDHFEESTQCEKGFRIIRMHQWKCNDCGKILVLNVEHDAVSSDRTVDGYYGVNYE